jgi:hypothetical protein
MLDPKEAAALGQYVDDKNDVITNALHVFADHMTEAAKNAMAEYQRGQDDEVIKAGQNRSMITNQGYRQSAEIFTDSARKARAAAAEINRLIDGDDDEDRDDREPEGQARRLTLVVDGPDDDTILETVAMIGQTGPPGGEDTGDDETDNTRVTWRWATPSPQD